MRVYEVCITERYDKYIEVVANSKEQAEEQVLQQYANGTIKVDKVRDLESYDIEVVNERGINK